MSHADDDHFDFEPIPGLPEELPEGERLVWQGTPNWIVLALTAFKVRWLLLYFAVLMGWRAYDRSAAGDDVATALIEASALWPLAITSIGILVLIAWYAAKTTMYSVTNRRIVFRIGMAYSITVNIPFTSVSAVAVKEGIAGTCDIPFTLNQESGLGYMHYWPHVRPWRFRSPEPMLRAVPNGKYVAEVLGHALADFSEGLPSSGLITGKDEPDARQPTNRVVA